MAALGYVPYTEPFFMNYVGFKELDKLGKEIKTSGSTNKCDEFKKMMTQYRADVDEYRDNYGGFYTTDLGYIEIEKEGEPMSETSREFAEDRKIFDNILVCGTE